MTKYKYTFLAIICVSLWIFIVRKNGDAKVFRVSGEFQTNEKFPIDKNSLQRNKFPFERILEEAEFDKSQHGNWNIKDHSSRTGICAGHDIRTANLTEPSVAKDQIEADKLFPLGREIVLNYLKDGKSDFEKITF